MPYKLSKKDDDTYSVSSPSGTKAKGTTKAKAKKQIRLLNAVEHGWTPTKAKKKVSKKTSKKRVRGSRSAY